MMPTEMNQDQRQQFDPALLSLLSNGEGSSSELMKSQLMAQMGNSENQAQINPMLLSFLNDDKSDVDVSEMMKAQMMSQMGSIGNSINPMLMSMLNDDGDQDFSAKEMMKAQMMSQMSSSGTPINPMLLSFLNDDDENDNGSKSTTEMLKQQMLAQMSASGDPVSQMMVQSFLNKNDESSESKSPSELLKNQMLAQMATSGSINPMMLTMLDEADDVGGDKIDRMKMEMLNQLIRDPETYKMASTLKAILDDRDGDIDLTSLMNQKMVPAFDFDDQFDVGSMQDQDRSMLSKSRPPTPPPLDKSEVMFSLKYPQFKDEKVSGLAKTFSTFDQNMEENSERLEDFAIEIMVNIDYKKDPLKMLNFIDFSTNDTLGNTPMILAIGNLINNQCFSKGSIHDFAISVLENNYSFDAYRTSAGIATIQREIKLSVPWQSVLEKDTLAADELKETISQMIKRDFRMSEFERLSVTVKSLTPSQSIADDEIMVEALVEFSAKRTQNTQENDLAIAIEEIVKDSFLFTEIAIPEKDKDEILQGSLEKSVRVVLKSGWSNELNEPESLYSKQLKSVIEQAFVDSPVWLTFGPLEISVENLKRSTVFYFGIEANMTIKGITSEEEWKDIFDYLKTVPKEGHFIGAVAQQQSGQAVEEMQAVTTEAPKEFIVVDNTHEIILSLYFNENLEDPSSGAYKQYKKILDLSLAEDDKNIEILQFKKASSGMTLAKINFPQDYQFEDIKKKVDAAYFLDFPEQTRRRKRSLVSKPNTSVSNRQILLVLALQYISGKILVPFNEIALLQNEENSFLVDAAFEFLVKDYQRVHESISTKGNSDPLHAMILYLNRLTESETLKVNNFLSFFFNPESLMVYQVALQQFSNACL
ncbi:Oidioi.mRNA.OKI2018_I69.PAR.g8979.t1.cds [Oikopleura dioica]|uniref:Oidioi.mRNA.OKI2018_I69.PAR.g8979.t1.cds n=1 Tax=Oikopleura dioica TaxID=34765 RepID=A0ABN7RMK2_OIKDI|nr:Oidioi.mRNA.OKI2018_I69.PAR.g8979.t1.cds [Oikopleura dioica]